MTVPTPECDKMLAVKDKSQEVGEFLSWLTGQGIELFQFHDEQEEYLPISLSNEDLLATYFGVDLVKAEQEKRAILKSLDA